MNSPSLKESRLQRSKAGRGELAVFAGRTGASRAWCSEASESGLGGLGRSETGVFAACGPHGLVSNSNDSCSFPKFIPNGGSVLCHLDF